MKYNILGKAVITGEEKFQIAADNFSIGPSESGYTLMWSITEDGLYQAYPEDESVPANENVRVLHSQPGAYFMLAGNTSEVTILAPAVYK